MAAKFLEDYVGVDDLIKQMNEQYPEGRLVSEIVEKTEKMVVFKTSFYTKDNVSPKPANCNIINLCFLSFIKI